MNWLYTANRHSVAALRHDGMGVESEPITMPDN